MESAWQAVQEFLTQVYAGAQGVISAAEPWQILLVIAALLLMLLLLAIGLRFANRSGESAVQALEETAGKVTKAEERAAEADEKAQRALAEKEEALKSIERSKSTLLAENASQLTLAKSRIEQLERQQSDELAFLSGARTEAARIVRDAKDYAFTVASRADVEYAEMMRHANEEAENLRALSQQRLDQAHDTLKKALNRATEIIAEAHAEAGRISRPMYEAPPARLMDPDSMPEVAAEEVHEAAQDT